MTKLGRCVLALGLALCLPTMSALARSTDEPKEAVRKVFYRDRYYWIPDDLGRACSTNPNKRAFVVLHLLSQMTLTKPKVFSPLLTIGR